MLSDAQSAWTSPDGIRFTVGTVNGGSSVGITGDVFLDGTLYGVALRANTVNANRLIAGTITSASGAIGALSVESLSIGDNAVTVAYTGANGSNISGTAAYQTAISYTVSINTAGLSGKTVSVLLTFTGQMTSSGGQWGAQVAVNGSPIGITGFGSTVFQPAFCVNGVYSFTASGGTDSFTAGALWFGTAGGTMTLPAGCVLTAVGVKR